MAEKDIRIQLLLETNEAEKSIGGIKQGLRDLKSAALEAGEGSEEFRKITARAGELQDKLNDVNGTISALAGNTAENLTNSFTRLASAGIGAFSAIKGAQAVFGVENKNLQEQLVKLQGLIALSSGIKEFANIGQAAKDFKTVIASIIPQLFTYTTATEGATVAQTGLNTAMRLSPIGLLVTAILAAAAAYALFANDADAAAEAQKKANKAQEDSTKFQIELAKARGDERAADKAELAELIRLRNEVTKQRNLILKEREQAKIDLALLLSTNNSGAEKIIKDFNDKIILEDEKLLKAQQDIDVKKADIQTKANTKANKAREEELKTRNEQAKKLADNTKILIDDANKLTQAEELRLADDFKRLEIQKGLDEKRIQQEFEASNKSKIATQARADALLAIENKYQADVIKLSQDLFDIAEKQILAKEALEIKAAKDLNQKKIDAQEDWNNAYQQILNEENKLTEDAARKRQERQQYYADLIFQVNRNLLESNRFAQSNITSLGVSISEATFKVFQLSTQNFKTELDKINAYTQAIGSSINGFLEQVANNEQNKLNEKLTRIQNAADQEQAILNANYDNGLISRESFDQQSLALENKQINELNKAKKKAFENDKKLRIAQAVIAGAQGAVAAFASAQVLPPPAGQIVGGILAGAVAALTAVNVNKIKSTQFEGSPNVSNGPTSSSPINIPSTGGGGISNTTPSNVALFGTAGRNQSLGGTTPTLVQAFVLESDITATQRRVRNIKSASEL